MKKPILSMPLLFLLALLAGCCTRQTSQIAIAGVNYPADATEITVQKLDAEDYAVFSQFENLEVLDISSVDISFEAYEQLTSQLRDGITVRWSVPFNGAKMPSSSTELTLSGDISSEDARAIKYFSQLSRLTIRDAEVTENLYTVIKTSTEMNPSLQLDCTANIYGVSFDYATELLNLNNIPIQSPDKLCLALEIFPNIKTVEMCDCGLRNEIMQGLREEYPAIKFVWMISFLKYKVRTDIQVFSTLAVNLNRPGNSTTFSPLFKYCTELRALDLGHMAITDISEITNLKKLHTLILADNRISDISPLAELKELEYIELFFNRISDISPLLALPKLEDLNICYNRRLKNPTDLTQCRTLKKLYISNCNLDQNEIATLRSGLPEGCELNTTAGNAVYNAGWRTKKNPRNTKIREAFKNWRKVKEYPTWDNIIYE